MGAIFTKFERESGNLNGKATYTSQDGRFAVAYVECNIWIWAIQLTEERWEILVAK